MSGIKFLPLIFISLFISACGGQKEQSTNQHLTPPPAAAPAINNMSFTGVRANYSISKTSTGFLVRDIITNISTNISSDITSLSFSDSTVNLLISQKIKTISAASVTEIEELYVAFFNRVPDADGLSYWIDQVASGTSITRVAESFYNVAIQYSNLTGYSSSMSNTDFIKIVYKNVLGRTSVDAEGLAYWSNSLANGSETRGSLVSSILKAAHSFKGNATYGYVADLLDNKLLVADYFAVMQGLNYNNANDSIIKGMAITAAITPTNISSAKSLILVGSDANGNVFADPSQKNWQTPQLLELSNEFNVTSPGSSKADMLVAVNNRGDGIVIWEQSDGSPNGSTLKTFSRRYSIDSGWQSPNTIPNLTSNGNFNTGMVDGYLFIDETGVVTWIRPNMETRRNSPATGWGSPFSPNPAIPTANYNKITSAVMDASGNIGVIISGGNVYNIALSAGGTWGVLARVDNGGALQGMNGQVALSSNGTAIAIWRESNPGDRYFSMKASRYLPTSGWGTPESIETSFTDVSSTQPRIAIDDQGNAIAMWQQGTHNTLHYNIFRSNIGWQGAVEMLSESRDLGNANINLEMTSDGRAVATWTSDLATLRSMKYIPNEGWSVPVTVDSYNINRNMYLDHNGQAFLIYTPSLQVTNNKWVLASKNSIFNSSSWSTPKFINIGDGNVNTSKSAVNKNGQGIAIWVQNDASNTSIRNSLWASVLK